MSRLLPHKTLSRFLERFHKSPGKAAAGQEHCKTSWHTSFVILFCLASLAMFADSLIWPYPHNFLHIVGWAGLLAMPCLLVERYGRHISFALLAYVVSLEMLEHWAMHNYRMLLGENLVFIISATNPEEVAQFLKMFGFSRIVLCILAIPLFFYCLWWLCYKLPSKIALPISKPTRLCRLFLSLSLLILFVLAHCPAILHRTQKTFFEQACWIACTKAAGKAMIEFRRLLGMMRHPQFPKGLEFTAEGKETPPLGIIIIGESSCRNYWSLYGYQRTTTPKLDTIKDELLVFQDLCGTATETSTGLLNLFVKRENLPDGQVSSSPLADLLISAGIAVSIVSTQANNSKYSSFQTAMFDSIGNKVYIAGNEKKDTKDLAILPHLKSILSNSTREKGECIFLHTVGNHFPCVNYRQVDDSFTGVADLVTEGLDGEQFKALNSYCNTMLHVDETIYDVIEAVMLAAKNRPAFVLFVSDHGETPLEPWRCAVSRDLWELPMVLWFNECYRQNFPDICEQARLNTGLAMTTDRLYWGMCSLMQLTFPGFPSSEDFLSRKYFPPEHRRVYRGKYRYEKDSERRFLSE